MLEILFWFTLINNGSDTLFFELTWIFINLTSLTEKEFLDEISWPELYAYIDKLLCFEKTSILDNALHLAANIAGSP